MSLVTPQGSFVQFDNIGISEHVDTNKSPPVSANNFPFGIIVTIIGLTTVSIFAGGSYFKKKRTKKILESLSKDHAHVNESILNLFPHRRELYFSLIGISQREKLPIHQEMKSYRFLLHPFRLTNMRLMHENDKLTAKYIKNYLNVSWSEYSHYVGSLKKRGYLEIQDEFVDGMKQSIVYITKFGREDYTAMIDLIKRFINLERLEMDEERFDFSYPHKKN